jgi:hypothetical protein
MPKVESAMFSGVENCWRRPPAERAVALHCQVVSFSKMAMEPENPCFLR